MTIVKAIGDATQRPTEFRGCMWNDGWEFDAPCVVYYPRKYACAGYGGNSGAIVQLVEDICFSIEEGEPHHDGGIDKECEWRGWGRHGFARRKRATHVIVKVRWSDDGESEIVEITKTDGPPPKDKPKQETLL